MKLFLLLSLSLAAVVLANQETNTPPAQTPGPGLAVCDDAIYPSSDVIIKAMQVVFVPRGCEKSKYCKQFHNKLGVPYLMLAGSNTTYNVAPFEPIQLTFGENKQLSISVYGLPHKKLVQRITIPNTFPRSLSNFGSLSWQVVVTEPDNNGMYSVYRRHVTKGQPCHVTDSIHRQQENQTQENDANAANTAKDATKNEL